MNQSKKAIIIGAGYGGMALANILGKAGYSVDIYEKNNYLGGRIAAIEKNKFLFDLGPSWYLMPEVFEQYYGLFDENAKERLSLIRFSPGYKVFFEDDQSVEVMGDASKDKFLFESIEQGAGAKLDKYVKNSSLTYELAVKYFLYNNFQRVRDLIKWPVIRHSAKMMLLSLKSLDKHVSRSFKDLRLKQLLEYHMVFLGSSPFQAPAIYSLMTHLDFSSGVYYPRRGMLSLIDDMRALGQDYDINYHTNSEVEKVLVKDGRASGVRLTDGQEFRADIVISNGDLAYTETVLIDRPHQTYPKKYWQKRQPGPGALLISLGIKGRLDNLSHHNLYFVKNWRENFESIYVNQVIPDNASVYVCNPTKTDASLAPKGHENLFVLVPIPSGVSLSSDQEHKLAERTIDVIAWQMDIADLKSRITTKHIFGPKSFESQFHAWQYNAFGGESHKLLQSVIFRTKNKSKKLENLYYVGAGTLPGIGLPMCLIGAEMTYKRIVGDKRAGPLQSQEIR